MSTKTHPGLQTQTNPAATTSTGTNTNPDNDTDLATSLLSPKQSHPHHPQNTTNPSPTATTKATDPSHGADRAMSHTGAWKPALDRRQSWDAQEYKHDQQKRQYMGGGDSAAGAAAGKAGFSEV